MFNPGVRVECTRRGREPPEFQLVKDFSEVGAEGGLDLDFGRDACFLSG
jgi:hypothetical protein